MIPISSTVIPLPVYKVSYSINAAPKKDDKLIKPEGPIHLITGMLKLIHKLKTFFEILFYIFSALKEKATADRKIQTRRSCDHKKELKQKQKLTLFNKKK